MSSWVHCEPGVILLLQDEKNQLTWCSEAPLSLDGNPDLTDSKVNGNYNVPSFLWWTLSSSPTAMSNAFSFILKTMCHGSFVVLEKNQEELLWQKGFLIKESHLSLSPPLAPVLKVREASNLPYSPFNSEASFKVK